MPTEYLSLPLIVMIATSLVAAFTGQLVLAGVAVGIFVTSLYFVFMFGDNT